MSPAVRLLAEGARETRELPVEPWVMGVGAFLALVFLLAVTLAFGKDR